MLYLGQYLLHLIGGPTLSARCSVKKFETNTTILHYDTFANKPLGNQKEVVHSARELKKAL